MPAPCRRRRARSASRSRRASPAASSAKAPSRAAAPAPTSSNRRRAATARAALAASASVGAPSVKDSSAFESALAARSICSRSASSRQLGRAPRSSAAFHPCARKTAEKPTRPSSASGFAPTSSGACRWPSDAPPSPVGGTNPSGTVEVSTPRPTTTMVVPRRCTGRRTARPPACTTSQRRGVHVRGRRPDRSVSQRPSGATAPSCTLGPDVARVVRKSTARVSAAGVSALKVARARRATSGVRPPDQPTRRSRCSGGRRSSVWRAASSPVTVPAPMAVPSSATATATPIATRARRPGAARARAPARRSGAPAARSARALTAPPA